MAVVYSMSVSVDGFIADREGGFEWRPRRLSAGPQALRDDAGAGLAAQAFELGLVDELQMFRYPVVIGGRTPFLPPVSNDVALDLIETRTFGSRVIYERYGRAARSAAPA